MLRIEKPMNREDRDQWYFKNQTHRKMLELMELLEPANLMQTNNSYPDLMYKVIYLLSTEYEALTGKKYEAPEMPGKVGGSVPEDVSALKLN